MESERRVVMVGDKGCGKSTLLAGLAECPLMATVPMDGPFVRWRYRCDSGEAALSRFLPLPQLEGLELVDCCPCSAPGAAEAQRAIIRGADVVIAVLDGRSPDSSPVWELLASEEAAAVEASVFAVTFANGPEVSGRVRELCLERLGRKLPIYCISPSSSAAMEVFCERIQDELDSPTGLRADIRKVVEESTNLMYKLGSALKTLAEMHSTNSSFLLQIETEIDHFLVRQRSDLPRLVDAYAEVAGRARPRMLRRLRWVLGWVYSPITLLRLRQLGQGCELFYYCHMRQEVLNAQQEADIQFIVSCAAHWKSARPRMQKELGCEIGEFPEERFAEELERLRAQLGRELFTPFAREQMRHRFALLFNAHAGWMRTCLTFICLFLIFGGLFGLLGQDLPAVGFVCLSGLIWLAASVAHIVASYRIRRQMDDLCQLLDTSARMTLGESLGRLVTSRMAAYRRLYSMPRNKVALLQQRLQPLQEQHTHVNRQLWAASAARM